MNNQKIKKDVFCPLCYAGQTIFKDTDGYFHMIFDLRFHCSKHPPDAVNFVLPPKSEALKRIALSESYPVREDSIMPKQTGSWVDTNNIQVEEKKQS